MRRSGSGECWTERKDVEMNKTLLARGVAKECGETMVQSTRIVRSVLEILAKALESGELVELTGFGTFRVKVKPAGPGWDPQRQEFGDLPERLFVKFKPSVNLTRRVRQAGVGVKSVAP